MGKRNDSVMACPSKVGSLSSSCVKQLQPLQSAFARQPEIVLFVQRVFHLVFDIAAGNILWHSFLCAVGVHVSDTNGHNIVVFIFFIAVHLPQLHLLKVM